MTPSTWKTISAEDYCLKVADGTHDTPKPRDVGEYLVTSKHITSGKIDLSSAYKISKKDFDQINIRSKVDQWDVLITMIGTVGEVVLIDHEPNYAIKNIGLFKCGNELKAKWLRYYLQRPDGKAEIQSRIGGTTQEYIALGELRKLPISFPPIEQQIKIVETLSSLDDKIDLLHRQNKTLEKITSALFRQRFVENQSGQKTGVLGEFVETTLNGEWGKDSPTSEHSQQVFCMRGTDIDDLRFSVPDRIPTRFVKEEKLKKISPIPGDLIIEISGGTEDQSTGRTVYVDESVVGYFEQPLIFSNFCRLIRPKRKEYGYFLYLYCQHLYSQDEFFNLENGTSGIKNLDYKHFLNKYSLIIPEKADNVLKFHSDIQGIFKKIGVNRLQIRSLSKLRDAFLPEFMSGRMKSWNNLCAD